jgi:two-component system LytT family response regulator
MIRTLIVDDEKPARARLRALLEEHPGIEIVGECSDGEAALARIMEGGIDLVLLDVEMPRMTGLEVVELTPAVEMPMVIFVTAYDQYAMRAFDAHAIDYLLKPYDRDRLAVAVSRAARWLRADQQEAQRSRIRKGSAAASGNTTGRPARIAVRGRGRISIVKIDSIDRIESEGNYVRFHVGAQSYLHRQPLHEVEQLLDPAAFVRVHRSAVVNLERIREIRVDTRGDATVILEDGSTVPLGRTYRDDLARRLAH